MWPFKKKQQEVEEIAVVEDVQPEEGVEALWKGAEVYVNPSKSAKNRRNCARVERLKNSLHKMEQAGDTSSDRFNFFKAELECRLAQVKLDNMRERGN